MLVLLHLDPKAPAHLLGIWVPPAAGSSEPRPWYPAPTTAELIAAERITEHGATRTWPELVAYLCGASPYIVWWEAWEVDDTEDLAAVYHQLVEEVFDQAAAMHGRVFGEGDQQLTVSMLTAGDVAALAADTPGKKIAVRLGFHLGAPRVTGRVSTLLAYFGDQGRLLVVATDPDRPEAIDLALAHGLAQAGNRDLWIAVPAGMATPLVRRAPFLDRKIRIWTHDGETPSEVMLPSRAEVFETLSSDELAAGQLDLGDLAGWIEPVTTWAATAPNVVPAHRPSYLAWHCGGRMVLKVTRPQQGRLVITAGVHYRAEPPVPVIAEGAVQAADAHRLVAHAAAACADRLDGTDVSNREHLIEASLQPSHLGLVQWDREFPARRPAVRGGHPSLGGDGRGYIDFLGIDRRRNLHIVETKIGPDDMLVLQALDYWTWASAQKKRLGDHFGVKIRDVIIDFVVSPASATSPALGPYSSEQAESLCGEIKWRFWTFDAADHHPPALHRLPDREVPAGSPRRSPPGFDPWTRRLQHHLNGWASASGLPLTAGVFLPDRDLGLLPAARPVAAALCGQGLDHRMLSHVRSSQAFALNLFAGLDEAGRIAVLAQLGIDATSCPPATFEWSDPYDRLAEATETSPHQTQVDVLLRPDGPDGRRLVFIEVKLSETDFGHCSAYQSPRNPDRHACAQPHPFGAEPQACFQLRNHDRGEPRRYLEVLGPFNEAPAGVGCWFRLGASQVMRNVAVARSLIEAGDVDSVTVALCAPVAHRAIWRRWKEAKTALHGVPGVALAELPADAVAVHLPLMDGLAVADRYLLDRSAIETYAASSSWQSWIADLFPSGAAYVVESSMYDGPHTHYIGQPAAEVVDGKLEISILPILHENYNPTTWVVDADELRVEQEGHGCKLQVEEGEVRCYLVTPDLAPANPFIDDTYRREVARRQRVLLPNDPPCNPLEDLPDLGVGA